MENSPSAAYVKGEYLTVEIQTIELQHARDRSMKIAHTSHHLCSPDISLSSSLFRTYGPQELVYQAIIFKIYILMSISIENSVWREPSSFCLVYKAQPVSKQLECAPTIGRKLMKKLKCPIPGSFSRRGTTTRLTKNQMKRSFHTLL